MLFYLSDFKILDCSHNLCLVARISFFRPQTGKVANVILDGDEANQDDDADEFLIEEKPKDALELEIEPRPSSSLNLADVSNRNYTPNSYYKKTRINTISE